MTIPFRVKLLTKTAKAPIRENPGDLWDLYADDFVFWQAKEEKCLTNNLIFDSDKKMKGAELKPQGRILVKTGISLELPKYYSYPEWIDFIDEDKNRNKQEFIWTYDDDLMLNRYSQVHNLLKYAVADIRPRSGLALKHGIQVLNSPGTIDNSYRKEIGVILYNAGHEPYTITKGDKIAQMLIRPLYPSKMEIVEHIEDTGRGGYNSTGY